MSHRQQLKKPFHPLSEKSFESISYQLRVKKEILANSLIASQDLNIIVFRHFIARYVNRTFSKSYIFMLLKIR
jgi:hypothetical protein